MPTPAEDRARAKRARLVASLRRAWVRAEHRYQRTGRNRRAALRARARYLQARDGETAMTLEEVATRAALVPTEYRDELARDLELGDVGGFELEAPEELREAPGPEQTSLFDGD